MARDDESAGELRGLGVRADRIHVAPDLVLALPLPDPPARTPRDPGSPLRIGVSLRPQQKAEFPVGDPELGNVARLLDRLVETREAEILLLPFLDRSAPFHRSSRFATDHEVLQRTVELMRHGDRTRFYDGSLHPVSIIQALGELDGLIAMRLHAAILGLKAGLQPLAIEYAPKIRRTMNRIGFGHRVVRMEELGDPALVQRVVAERVDPATLARLATDARKNLTLLAGSLRRGRRRSPLIGLPLALLALIVQAGVAFYAALPPLRPRARRPSSGVPG